jgi:hypothetical protein
VHDPADHPPVIDPGNPARIPRQQRRQPRELLFRKPEFPNRHRKLPLRKLESHICPPGNPLYGSRP